MHDIWLGSHQDLHANTRILLHFSQFMLRRQKRCQPYGPWENIPSSIWTEEEAPKVDEDNSENTTRLNFGVLNCSCMLLEVAGFQGFYRGKHHNNWRCARAVRKRPHKAPTLHQNDPPGTAHVYVCVLQLCVSVYV